MNLAFLLWMATVVPQPLAAQTCLATTVYLEARNQPTIGQMAVAEVVLRRRDEGTWGHTVCDVTNAPHQFAPTITPASYPIKNLEAFSKAWAVADKALSIWKLPPNQRDPIVPGADHFATVAVSNAWTGQPLRVIGDHAFYAVN